MIKLIMTKGLPGSGKTTWALEQVATSGGEIKRVNKDELRAMIDAGKWSKQREAAILMARDTLVEMWLIDKFSVIVDDTNLDPIHEINLRTIAQLYGAQFDVQDFTDIPLKTCLMRNASRAKPVPEKVILKMHKQFLRKEPTYKPYDPSKKEAIIVDIDGTIATHPQRGHYEYDQVIHDKSVPEIIELVRHYSSLGLAIIIVSGRDDYCREDTILWLREHNVSYDHVYMRKTGDQRPDNEVKQEIYQKKIEPSYNIRMVFDDRNQVVDMWRKNGLRCLQVANGDF
jgi:predicted kinase